MLRAARPGPGAGIEDEMGMPSMCSLVRERGTQGKACPGDLSVQTNSLTGQGEQSGHRLLR